MSNFWESRYMSKSTGNLRQMESRKFHHDYFLDVAELNSTRSYGKASVAYFGGTRRGSGASDSNLIEPGTNIRTMNFRKLTFPRHSLLGIDPVFHLLPTKLLVKTDTDTSMPSSGADTPVTTSRPPTIRSRASSAASSGLDSSQVHLLLNKRDSRSSIFTANSYGDPQSPTSIASLSSTAPLLRGSLHEDGFEYMRRFGERDQLPPRKISADKSAARKNIVTVMPRNEKSPMNTERPLSLLPQQKHNSHSETEIPKQLERMATEPSLSMPTTMYLNEIIWQIDDLVFVGGIEASCNMNLLCRLNVTFFLDLTDDPDRKDNKTPCLCSTPSRHSRYMVDIQLPKENAAFWIDSNGQQVSMTDLYERFVTLTDKAAKAGRRVLVFSNKGRNKAPAFAAAYLMHKHRISRASAVARVQRAMETMRPAVSISDYLQRSLMRYQVHKNIEVDSAYDPTHSASIFRVPRTAWI